DSETGLVYMRARYYAPVLGRFLSRDPLGLGSDINVYGYAGEDPIDFCDVLGLEYTFLGLRGGTWAGIGAGAVTFGLTGNPFAALGVGFGVRGYFNSRVDGNSVGQA